MKDERNRLGKGFAVAVVAHVIFALLLGVFGFSFNSNRPPEILEVSLVAGGGAPEEPQEEVVEEAEPVIEEEDQIVETKEKPKPVEQPKKPVVDKKPTKNPAPKKGDNKAVGKGDGIGEGQGGPATPPRPVFTVEPKCPASAHDIAAKDKVKMKFRMHITYKGRVVEASILESSGNADFDKVALEAVRKWRFSPAKNEFKQKIDCRIDIPITFKII